MESTVLNRMYALLTMAYCALIFGLSSIPRLQPPGGYLFPGMDKLVHGTEYAVLALLASFSIRVPNTRGRWTQCLGPVLFASFYAATDEIHQYFVPMRSCDFWDWCADTTGALLAAWLLHAYWERNAVPAASALAERDAA